MGIMWKSKGGCKRGYYDVEIKGLMQKMEI